MILWFVRESAVGVLSGTVTKETVRGNHSHNKTTTVLKNISLTWIRQFSKSNSFVLVEIFPRNFNQLDID